MKRAIKMLLVALFFTFIASGLAAHVFLICSPDQPYLTQVEQAFLAEGGQNDVTAPMLIAWDRAKTRP